MTDVAVVIPNHNGHGLVGRCVAGAREGGAAEIVVVDDASSDDSPAEAEAAGARLLRSPRRGFAAAVNTGVAATTAPNLLILNSDCFLDPDALHRLAAVLETLPSIALCGAHRRNADGTPAKSAGVLVSAGNALVTALGVRGTVVPQKEHGVERVPFVPLACALVRRSAWESVGGLDEGYRFYFEDYDLCWRLGRERHSIAVCWDAHALHVGGASSSAHDPQRWFTQYHESRARYLRKRGGIGFIGYAGLWPPVAAAHALRRLLRRGPDERRWAAAYAAAATAGLGRQASNRRHAASRSSS